MMFLNLTVGDEIELGDGILIAILEQNPRHPGFARIGIAAPESVKIMRGELVLSGKTLSQGDSGNHVSEQ